jgi:NADPH-dependent 2,4-dienoyl-CoA reductase/sulfur reductase-like enzyme
VSALRERYDLVVIGAGPAGLAAAARAAALGLDTVLLDEQPAPGGQIYRAVTETPVRDRRVLGPDYWRGATLVEAFTRSGAQHVACAAVWSVTPDGEIGVSLDGTARLVQARRVILATGALERPMPIPGWTLPGVMTIGAAQTLLKSSGLVAEGEVVLAGSGPLLWLFARQHLAAGGRIAALLDTTPRANRWSAARHAARFLASPYARKGVRLIAAVRRRVRVIGGVTALRAEGDERVRALVYRRGAGTEQRLAADLVLLHQGVVPHLNLALAAGCRATWHDAQRCFRPVVDEWGATDLDAIAITGDGAGIAGAEAAEQRGHLAALDAASRLGRIDRAERDRAGQPPRVELARWTRGRRFLDSLYRPADNFCVPAADTLVCRCEEVTAQQVRDAVALGVAGPNQLKAFLRCGMGPCQGRLCGLTVSELIAAARGVSPADIGHYRLRPPVKPITLGELATLPKSDAAMKAVARG